MKIAQINMVPNGSTGKIMLQLADIAREHGHEARTYTPVKYIKGKKTIKADIKGNYYWGSRFESMIHVYAGIALGMNGMFSVRGTRQLIKELKAFKPDIIHLHNIHGFCINLPLLFRYIKKNNLKIFWTLHDCWTFTGHCPYFTMAQCDKWKTECKSCPQPSVYPKMMLDTSRRMYKLKKKWFCGVDDMTLITPSEWLADLARESYLNCYPIKTIHNGIDLDVFKPTESNFKARYKIDENKYIVLGVAFGWGKRKGLDVFEELARRLDRAKYQIVLVGTDAQVDSELPDNIISINKTQNQTELAEIYTAADVFANPTREEVLGLVNIEALACGTPGVTFETGGSPECYDNTCGSVVPCDDIDAMEREIIRICNDAPYPKKACLKKAKSFDKNDRFEEYINLYENSTYST